MILHYSLTGFVQLEILIGSSGKKIDTFNNQSIFLNVRCKRSGRQNRHQTNLKTYDKMLTLRKIKRAAMQPHKPTQIAAHLILPNRTSGHSDR